MAESNLTFNTPPGQTVGRELLIAYLNVGETASPEWAPIGKRVEDSSIEFDWQTETKVIFSAILHHRKESNQNAGV